MPVAERTSEPPAEELETAVESVAAVVRAFGSHGFDTDDFDARSLAETCEAWALHLLVHAEAPDVVAPRPGPPRRMWRGVIRFVAERRKAEQRYVVQSQTTLRDAVFAFAHAISRILSGDHGADQRVAAQLGRLRTAVASPSPDELRREVGAAVDAIEAVMQERRERSAKEASELSAKVQTLSAQLEEARRDGAMDALTKIANRKTFDDHVARVVDLATVMGSPASLLMIDIDHFKQVNDAYGHPAGDAVLRAVCDAIARTCKRKSDLVARYGGEEIAVVLADTVLDDARALARRVQAAVRSVRAGEGAAARAVTVSIGAAQLRGGESLDEWLARADKALYAAKAGGRDRVDVG